MSIEHKNIDLTEKLFSYMIDRFGTNLILAELPRFRPFRSYIEIGNKPDVIWISSQIKPANLTLFINEVDFYPVSPRIERLLLFTRLILEGWEKIKDLPEALTKEGEPDPECWTSEDDSFVFSRKIDNRISVYDWSGYNTATRFRLTDLIWFANEVNGYLKRKMGIWQTEQTVKYAAILTLKQIALIHVYNGPQITRKNSNEIAKGYNYASGDALYNSYTRYSSRTNRLCLESTPAKSENKRELIESVIPFIKEEQKQRIIDELNTLNTRIIDSKE